MDNKTYSRQDEDFYLCQKTGKRVPKSDPRCPKPKDPCKYRLNCIVYALYKDAQTSSRDARNRDQYTVTFLPDHVSIVADSSETLLDIARRSGINISSPCGGEGQCGKCKVIVREGEVDYTPNRNFTDNEFRAGYVLACQTRILGNVTVEIPPESREENIQAIGDEVPLMEFGKSSDIQIATADIDVAVLDPIVKGFLVRVKAPSLEEPTGDLERICRSVAEQAGVECSGACLSTLRQIPALLRTYDWQATVYAQMLDGTARAIDAARPHNRPNYGVAIDIGTTTIVVQMVDLDSGQIVSTRGVLNSQTSYGEDVLTRIIHACRDRYGLETLHNLVVDAVNELLVEMYQIYECGPTDVRCAVCAGNSTMIHLFLGIPPCAIRQEPFVSVTNFPPTMRAGEVKLDILPDAPLVCVPGISGYVGGDITAGALATGIFSDENPCVLIDVGTNGEIVIGNRDWLICCASSAGPAFEGGGVRCGMRATTGAIQKLWIDDDRGIPRVETVDGVPARGICGSGLIDTIAELFKAAMIDRSGKFTERVPANLIRETDEGKELVLVPRDRAGTDHDIVITETDIAHAIRSKGAIFTAMNILMQKVGMLFQDVSKLYIAGGFGNYLNLRNAVTVGLIPDLPTDRFRFVGNASLHGARMALLARENVERLTEIARNMTYVELSMEPRFMDSYVASLFLPHTDETLFPSVAEMLGRKAEMNESTHSGS
ncbi:MAG: DUF4445 domain-containing protein [Candidatus Hydrogenedentes bacterium]|nr:DUF4445 domain-containing protein [Candidatus Hydrogenedentota bacterium]